MNAGGNVRYSVVILGEHDLMQSSACAADSSGGDGDPHARRHYERAAAEKAADKRPPYRACGSVVMRSNDGCQDWELLSFGSGASS